MIHAYGDSFVVGDQDTEGQDIDHLKHHVSFVALWARHHGLELQNHAECGAANYPQLDLLTRHLQTRHVTEQDWVLFGLTSTTRDRFSLLKSTRAHVPVINQSGIVTNDLSVLLAIDQIYILSILDKLSELFKVRIVKFNCFTNALTGTNLQFNDYVSDGTLLDIINDTWGQQIDYPSYHGAASIPLQYKKFYTKHQHPSVEGHKKLAQWFIENIRAHI